LWRWRVAWAARRLAHGLAQQLPPENLTIVVNTGDDFTRYGLAISPDLDTVMYTLAGLADPVNGWVWRVISRQMIGMLELYGDDTWFGLGDKDVATHLLRTLRLTEGQSLSQVTAQMASALGVAVRLLPMSDNRVSTVVETADQGTLAFQEYFVRHRWQPCGTGLRLRGRTGRYLLRGYWIY